MISKQDLYKYYKGIIQNEQYPILFLDMDKLESNTKEIKNRRLKNISIRIASKSIRSVSILNKILESDSIFKGILSYSGKEAIFLSQNGIGDIVVAYPVININELILIAEEIHNGADITLMVDNSIQVEKLNKIAENNSIVIPVCIDIDMSTKFLKLHFGVFRSPINNKKLATDLAELIKNLSNIKLRGIMGYEAQIAGLPDRSPAKNFILNLVIRKLKKRSIKKIKRRREEIVKSILELGHNLEFVNGGGTGSVETSSNEDVVTEVTVGSGFFSSHLFDYYDNFKHSPSLMYAIEITRVPKNGIYTCHGGGYVASGSVGIDKIPKPFLPLGAELLVNEMAGEVQTPVKYSGELNIGDPIIMRHSKSGELCEHFNEIVLIKEGKIVNRVKTYRGEGKIFL